MTDLSDPSRPKSVFTGDTLFVGDVGRPDLSGDYTPQQLAAMLFQSLHEKLLSMPDETADLPRSRCRVSVRSANGIRTLVDHRQGTPHKLRAAGCELRKSSFAF